MQTSSCQSLWADITFTSSAFITLLLSSQRAKNSSLYLLLSDIKKPYIQKSAGHSHFAYVNNGGFVFKFWHDSGYLIDDDFFTVRAFYIAYKYCIPVVVVMDEIVALMREKIHIPEEVAIFDEKPERLYIGETF